MRREDDGRGRRPRDPQGNKAGQQELRKSHLSLYQAVTGSDETSDLFRQFSPDFFDPIVIDECHRGQRRRRLRPAQHPHLLQRRTRNIGLTATPKETADVRTSTTSASRSTPTACARASKTATWPRTKVIRVDLDRDTFGWRPTAGMTDKHGNVIEDRAGTPAAT